MMTETVDTSIHDTVQPHRLSKQSKIYEYEFPLEREDLLRFDIPWDMVNKVGIRWVEKFVVYRDDNKLYFSTLPLQTEKVFDLYEYWAPVLLSKKGGDPTSEFVSDLSDNVYTLLSREFIPQWSPFEEITYTYQNETETEERHIEVTRGWS